MSSINFAGFKEIPPVSKQTPFPTNANGFVSQTVNELSEMMLPQLIIEAIENLDIDWDYMIDRSQSNSDNQHRIDMENWGDPGF